MPDTCLVTFTARDSGFAVLPGATVTFIPTGAPLASQGASLLVRTTRSVVADGGGAGSVALVPGTYRVETMGSEGVVATPILVPDVVAASIGDCMAALDQAAFSLLQVALLAATTGRMFETPAQGYASAAVAVNDVFLALNAGVLSVYRKSSPTTGVLLGPLFTAGSFSSGLTVNGPIVGTAVTQSDMDGTAGRLLRVGDFGLGAQIAPQVANLNAVNRSGISRITAADAATGNAPGGAGNWTVVTALWNAGGAAFQIAAAADTAHVFHARTMIGGVWQAWQRLDPQAFGLGALSYADLSPEATDLPTRIFRTNAAIAGFGAGGHTLHMSRLQNAQGAQIAVRDSSDAQVPLAAVRHRSGTGTWSTWSVLFGRLNLLGAVTQVGGVPTGAALEPGSNANGTFERTAAGWQRCVRTDLTVANSNTAEGAVWRSPDITWTFPATFAAGVLPAVSIHAVAPEFLGAAIISVSNTAVTFRIKTSASLAAAIPLNLSAHGRWSTMT